MNVVESAQLAAAERLYRLSESEEWHKLERVLDWNAGFAFLVLLVPDRFGAIACRASLDRLLQSNGRHLVEIDAGGSPEEAAAFAPHLFSLEVTAADGAVWVNLIRPMTNEEAALDYRDTIRAGISALNQQRDSLRQRLRLPLFLVGTQNLQALLRSAAPDLWSIRTAVITIRPPVQSVPSSEARPDRRPEHEQSYSYDLELALDAVARLRGRAGLEEQLAQALLRAAQGYFERNQWHSALEHALEARVVFNSLPSDGADRERGLAETYRIEGHAYMELGSVARAKPAYLQSEAIFAKLTSDNPLKAEDQREWSVSLNELGDVLVAAGDLAAARSRYEQSLAIAEKLVRANPTSAPAQPDWERRQRDWSVSLEKLGGVQEAEGDLGGARRSYEQALEVREKLARANPASAAAQRDRSVSLNKLGGVQEAEGDLGGARRSYEQALEIHEKLARANPISAAAQRDLIVSYAKLAQVTGDKSWWKRALDVAETLHREGRLAPVDARMLEYLRERAR